MDSYDLKQLVDIVTALAEATDNPSIAEAARQLRERIIQSEIIAGWD